MNSPVRLIDSVSDPPPLWRRSITTASTFLVVELLEQLGHVAGRALEVVAAGLGAAHVHVEAGQIDHADLVRRAVGLLAGFEITLRASLSVSSICCRTML